MSKEIKVSIFVIASILIAVLGSRYLLGLGLLDTSNTYHVIFNETPGLYNSNLVLINGFKVGKVSGLEMIKEGENSGKIKATLEIKDDISIPVGTKAIQASESMLMGDVIIKLIANPNENTMIEDGGFLEPGMEVGMIDNLGGKFSPVADNLNKTLENINMLFDFETKNAQTLNYTVENLNKIINTFNQTGEALNGKINSLGKTLDNLESFTQSLENKSTSIETSLDNLETLTTNLKDIEVKQTLQNLEKATGKLNTALDQVNNTDNTIGALLNDKEVYDNLDKAVNNLNLLLKDVRLHPGRYVTIQVFGKKKKEDPITSDDEE